MSGLVSQMDPDSILSDLLGDQVSCSHINNTVERPLTDTSCKRTPPKSGHQTVVLAISLLKLYISNFP